MPCADEKGLLPGRGAPGVGALLSAGAGASGAAGAGVAAAGAGAGAAGAAGASGAGLGPGLGPGFGPGVAPEVVPGLAAEGAGFAAGAAGAAPLSELSASIAARSLRATGGSMVEDGLFTNSPSSLSFASAILLSTPSSAAISCTRGLPATILLSESVHPDRADH